MNRKPLQKALFVRPMHLYFSFFQPGEKTECRAGISCDCLVGSLQGSVSTLPFLLKI